MTQNTAQPDSALCAVILAAGKGTRMGSDLPKVLHEVAGRPMLHWVIDACRDVCATPIIVVVGHGGKLVQAAMDPLDGIHFVVQDPQMGTGHAVETCRDELAGLRGDALVLAGDGPLIRGSTLRALHDRHCSTGAAATLATAIIDDPTGYGRIIRNADGGFVEIVEHRNCTDEQYAIDEIYPSYACFAVDGLLDALSALAPNEASGEYYLTDVPTMLAEAGARVEVIAEVPAEDVLSINTPEQLAQVDSLLRERLATEAAT